MYILAEIDHFLEEKETCDPLRNSDIDKLNNAGQLGILKFKPSLIIKTLWLINTTHFTRRVEENKKEHYSWNYSAQI